MSANLFGTEYRCLAVDPPWLFGDSLPGASRGAAKNYRCLSVDDLCRFPERGPSEFPIIAADAWLFMWRVSAMVEEAYRVVRAWGFTPKSEIVWEKMTGSGKHHFGMGHFVRASHETCIVATRGRPEVLSHSVRSVFEASVGAHSEKPQEFFRIVEKLAPGPRVEMFARIRREGWTSMGDEVPPEEVANG
jgi:N6-adenosine-specific RNA methylase IME4